MKRLLISVAAFLALLSATPAFAFRNYNVPSESMSPTLFAGDTITAAFYGVDYDALAAGKTLEAAKSEDPRFQPKLGDIAVFRSRTDDDFVMRIVALPGDRIAVEDGRLRLNGREIPTEDVGPIPGACVEGETCRFVRETLPNGVTYVAMQMRDGAPGDTMAEIELPAGAYFLMGDNRDNAFDSRFRNEPDAPVGLMPRETLVGRIQTIWPNADHVPGPERLAGYPKLR